MNPNWDMGPLSTFARTFSCGAKVTLVHVVGVLGAMTVYLSWQPPVLPNLSNYSMPDEIEDI